MIRPIAIAALFAAAFTLPSLAQNAKTESSSPAIAQAVTPLKLRTGPGCLNSFPRKLSGFLPGLLVWYGMLHDGCDAGRA